MKTSSGNERQKKSRNQLPVERLLLVRVRASGSIIEIGEPNSGIRMVYGK